MKILSTLFCFLTSFFLFAQNPYDCISAMGICDDETIFVELNNAMGNNEEMFGTYCSSVLDVHNFEQNVVWFKYRFTTYGRFEFTITPGSFPEDLDFVVFKTATGDCNGLEAVRCSFTGESIGQGLDSVCLGPTGLVFGSLDFVEFPGCNEGDDNFLAPVHTTPGEVLYLMVKSFYGNANFTIEHTGTTTISCDPVGAEESRMSTIDVFPNPVNDFVFIENSENYQRDLLFEIIDLNGKVIKNKLPLVNSKLDVADLAKGVYFLKISDQGSFFRIKKLIKL